MAGRSGSRNGATLASAEVMHDAGNSSVITRSGIMAASRLKPGPETIAPDAVITAEAEETEPGRIVATVNGEPIYEAEIDRAIARRMREFPAQLTMAQQREVYLDELLWSIDLRLLLREAAAGPQAGRRCGGAYPHACGGIPPAHVGR